ncbi:MAG: hypothetical protein ACKODU_10420, partial [Limnohabitans sp.]
MRCAEGVFLATGGRGTRAGDAAVRPVAFAAVLAALGPEGVFSVTLGDAAGFGGRADDVEDEADADLVVRVLPVTGLAVAVVSDAAAGLDPEFRSAAHERIRLSDLTLPHAMAR